MLPTQLSTTIAFEVQKRTHFAYVGFRITLPKGGTKVFRARHEDVEQLRALLRGRVTFASVNDLYRFEEAVGAGETSKVSSCTPHPTKQDL